jgi:hypothetical protein
VTTRASLEARQTLQDRKMKTVLIYVDASKQVGDADRPRARAAHATKRDRSAEMR